MVGCQAGKGLLLGPQGMMVEVIPPPSLPPSLSLKLSWVLTADAMLMGGVPQPLKAVDMTERSCPGCPSEGHDWVPQGGPSWCTPASRAHCFPSCSRVAEWHPRPPSRLPRLYKQGRLWLLRKLHHT